MIGRTAALLVDLAVDLTPAGWRLVPRPGLDLRRAREFLARDLDALHEAAAAGPGPSRSRRPARGRWPPAWSAAAATAPSSIRGRGATSRSR